MTMALRHSAIWESFACTSSYRWVISAGKFATAAVKRERGGTCHGEGTCRLTVVDPLLKHRRRIFCAGHGQTLRSDAAKDVFDERLDEYPRCRGRRDDSTQVQRAAAEVKEKETDREQSVAELDLALRRAEPRVKAENQKSFSSRRLPYFLLP
jgi:hypothetical protein